ncbi:DNA repair and recombination protein rad54b [Gaertneriomyces sp. JEL0708]|nr:DNA repair and recombination protein rad54b [Gaertneriomyces sp. JEL0708]
MRKSQAPSRMKRIFPLSNPMASSKDLDSGAPGVANSVEDVEPPQKKSRTGLGPLHTKPLLPPAKPVQNQRVLKRTPLLSSAPKVERKPDQERTDCAQGETAHSCYRVVYRKKQHKKHKTWDADGILILRQNVAHLLDQEGKEYEPIGSGKVSAADLPLQEGETLSVAGKELEVTGSIEWQEYASGKCFISSSVPTPTNVLVSQRSNKTQFKALTPANTVLHAASLTPRHNPLAPNALVMPPLAPQQIPRGAQVVDVVVDPVISQHLRPHQREGVTFLYQCAMQMKDYNGCGAILADEMGLGKTIQTIALIWTLLKQNPIGRKPVVNRALIICPASLIANWKREFKKWLGDERIQVCAVDDKDDIKNFTVGRLYQVLVIGYEKMRACQDLIIGGNFDLVVCDEGHRLKNSQIRTAQAIKALSTRRRIVLSGTPIQNDLKEFYSMVDFVNPGVLGTPTTFKKVFEDPIMRGRDACCSKEDFSLGLQRAEELSRLTQMFILRRTSEVNVQYLPPKTELVLFCKPTALQLCMYRSLVNAKAIAECLGSGRTQPGSILGCITNLKKLMNAPQLLSHEHRANIPDVPAEMKVTDVHYSGKLVVLFALLEQIKTLTREKVVIVSNYTETLDIIAAICEERAYGYLRLDGKTAVSKRQDHVDQFNNSKDLFLFLLSSKAGGVGLNLTGASRLVLYDIDWNPSVCQQAMARIWRDGQKRSVKIYRMLTTGTIEERIYQRQLTKVGLSDAVIDRKNTNINTFTVEELRNLFTIDDKTECLTHDLLKCGCQAMAGMTENGVAMSQQEGDVAGLDTLKSWSHVSLVAGGLGLDSLHLIDEITSKGLLKDSEAARMLSFILYKTVGEGSAVSAD